MTYIGDEAFQFCSALESITLSENVTHIGEYAFGGWHDSERIPVRVVEGSYAHSWCLENDHPYTLY